MEIVKKNFGFSVVEDQKELAYLQLIQTRISIEYKETVSEEKKLQIVQFCEQRKKHVYKFISKPTSKGHEIGVLYLNGDYFKVAELNYGKLEILEPFSNLTTEIECYVNENILENFTVCPC
jgi:hypoxanthine phosphoribosyltransferase